MTDDTKRPAPAERAPADPALEERLAELDAKADIRGRVVLDTSLIIRDSAADLIAIAAVSNSRKEVGDLMVALVNAYRAGTLRATPAAEGDGWLPIESAPRDGTSVLVCNDGRIHPDSDGNHQVVFWDDEPRQGSEDFRWMTSDGPTFHKDAFTHWRPLPPPPAGPAQEDGR